MLKERKKDFSFQDQRKGEIFYWWLELRYWVDNDTYELGIEVSCPRNYGGCGKNHYFTINISAEDAELFGFKFDWDEMIWQDENECEMFAEELKELVEEEWDNVIRAEFLKMAGVVEEAQEPKKTKKGQTELIPVKLRDITPNRILGGYKRVGFQNQKEIFFRCGWCDKILNGAGHTQISKNRNNTTFWGLTVIEKILCLNCLRKKYYHLLKGEKRKTFRKYLKRGYV